MKRLLFERLELLSLSERKARTVEFHPRLTVITGENGVGKSSVIKSLYWTLGAAPAVMHPR
ncbi:AAA family ATPase, partial [Microvirga sp. P5_D2]